MRSLQFNKMMQPLDTIDALKYSPQKSLEPNTSLRQTGHFVECDKVSSSAREDLVTKVGIEGQFEMKRQTSSQRESLLEESPQPKSRPAMSAEAK